MLYWREIRWLDALGKTLQSFFLQDLGGVGDVYLWVIVNEIGGDLQEDKLSLSKADEKLFWAAITGKDLSSEQAKW